MRGDFDLGTFCSSFSVKQEYHSKGGGVTNSTPGTAVTHLGIRRGAYLVTRSGGFEGDFHFLPQNLGRIPIFFC